MNDAAVSISQEQIVALCRKYHIRKLALFGSVLRDDFRADSDIDVLVEFEAGVHVGWDIIAIQDDLSDLFGRNVDLNTPGFLSRHIREKVLNSAQVIYERAG